MPADTPAPRPTPAVSTTPGEPTLAPPDPSRTDAEWRRMVAGWLEPALWPTPSWAVTRQRRGLLPRYDAYVLQQTRLRYLELESDFRTLFGNWVGDTLGGEPVDVVTGQHALELLRGARRALDQADPDPLAVGGTLDLVERSMVWATPSYILVARIPGLLRRLALELPTETRAAIAPLVRRLERATDDAHVTIDADGERVLPVPMHELRSAIDEATVVLNAAVAERQIASGLQLERLSILRDRGLWLLGALALLMPVLLPGAKATTSAPLAMPFVLRFVPVAASDAWLGAVAVALVGAAGGFLSGLLQARNQTVSAAEYQASVLRLELRPLLGATIALVLFVLLSWGIVPGVAITSGGSYLLLAFLSGFSERYFLRLLDLDAEDAAQGAQAARATAALGTAQGAVAALGGVPGAGGDRVSDGVPNASPNGAAGGLPNGTRDAVSHAASHASPDAALDVARGEAAGDRAFAIPPRAAGVPAPDALHRDGGPRGAAIRNARRPR